MDRNKKEIIAKSLKEKGVNKTCPRCDARDFEVVGQTLILLTENDSKFTIDWSAIPVGIVACSECGFITLHCMVCLNLMPKD